MNEKPVTAEDQALDELRQRLKAREAAPDVEPITPDELRQAHRWWVRWSILRYLLIAFRKLMLWIAGVGAGVLVLWDLLIRLIEEGTGK